MSLSKNRCVYRPWAIPASVRYWRLRADLSRRSPKGEGGSAEREGGRQAHARVLEHEHQKARLSRRETECPQLRDAFTAPNHVYSTALDARYRLISFCLALPFTVATQPPNDPTPVSTQR